MFRIAVIRDMFTWGRESKEDYEFNFNKTIFVPFNFLVINYPLDEAQISFPYTGEALIL